MVGQRILIPSGEGSNPSSPTNFSESSVNLKKRRILRGFEIMDCGDLCQTENTSFPGIS